MVIKVKSGVISSSHISISPDSDTAEREAEAFDQILKDKDIHKIDDFRKILASVAPQSDTDSVGVGTWLNHVFGISSGEL